MEKRNLGIIFLLSIFSILIIPQSSIAQELDLCLNEPLALCQDAPDEASCLNSYTQDCEPGELPLGLRKLVLEIEKWAGSKAGALELVEILAMINAWRASYSV